MIKFIIRSLYSQIPNYYRRGKIYRSYLSFLRESDNWSSDKIKKYREEKEKELFSEIKKNVDYYKSFNFNHDITDKNTIKNSLKKLTSNINDNERLIKCTTGGSTGKPTIFYISDSSIRKNQAFVDHILDINGHTYLKPIKKVVFRGDLLPNNKKFIKVGYVLYLSSYHLKNEDLELYAKLIEKFKPKLIHAFPSSIVILTNFIINNRSSYCFNSVKTVLLSSETCSINNKKRIKSIFNANIIDFYSNSEQTILSYSINFNKGIFPFQYGSFFLKKNIIYSTSYLEKKFPLINYKTDDELSGFEVDDDGNYRYDEIKGRIQTFLDGKNGEKVSVASLNMHDDIFNCIYAFQFIQPSIGKVIINIVVADDYHNYKCKVEKYFMSKLRYFDVSFMIVKTLDRTISGKEKILIKEY